MSDEMTDEEYDAWSKSLNCCFNCIHESEMDVASGKVHCKITKIINPYFGEWRPNSRVVNGEYICDGRIECKFVNKWK